MKSQKSVKKIIAIGLLVSVIIAAIAISILLSHRYDTDAYYDSIKTVSQMDARYGNPIYVLKDYPTVMGDSFISEEEMKKGMVLRVYVVRKFPSSLMALVKHKNGEELISGKTTYVP